MRLNTITAAGLAVSANALLLPPQLSSSDSDIINALPIELPNIEQSSSLRLACPGCPVPTKAKDTDGHVSLVTSTDTPSFLKMDFKVDGRSGSDRLLLNGFELYPNTDPLHHSLTAHLLTGPKTRPWPQPPPKSWELEVPPPELGFGLHVQNVAKSEEDLLELILVELQIIEVGNVFVDGIENVHVKLIKTPDNKLLIQDIGSTPSHTMPKNPMDKQEECTTFLCKWRAMLMSQIARLRAQKKCPGRKGHGAHGHVKVDADGRHHLPGHRRPHGFGHGHHGHRVHKHSWGQLFKNITSHILLPIAIGIVAGVSVSIIGMMAGTFIVYFWRTFFRPAGRRHHHRRRAGSCHKAAQHEANAADEKAGLMAHQEEAADEVPPAYVEEGVVASDAQKPENEA